MSPAPRVLQNHPAAGEAGSGSRVWMTRGLRVDRDGRRPLSTTRPTSAEGSPAASGSSSRHVSPHLATPAPPERLALLHSLSIATVCVPPRPDKGLPRGSVLSRKWMAKTAVGCTCTAVFHGAASRAALLWMPCSIEGPNVMWAVRELGLSGGARLAV